MDDVTEVVNRQPGNGHITLRSPPWSKDRVHAISIWEIGESSEHLGKIRHLEDLHVPPSIYGADAFEVITVHGILQDRRFH